MLARQLAEALSLPLLDKDDILDRLFDADGIGDSTWRRRLSRESDVILEREAVASNGAILTSLWRVPGMAADSGTSTHWLQGLSDLVVHVQCVCAPEIAAKRYLERKRHAGHLDGHATYSGILTSLQALAALGALDVGPRIDVDTSDSAASTTWFTRFAAYSHAAESALRQITRADKVIIVDDEAYTERPTSMRVE
jgi:hypothetical protein